MKRFRLLLVCLTVLFCGIVFNSCGCSNRDVKPGYISIDSVEGAKKDGDVYVASKGSFIKITYTVGPPEVGSNVSILVDFLKDYVKTTTGSKVYTGVTGVIELECLTASNKNSGSDDLEVINLKSGTGSANNDIKLRIVVPEELEQVENVRVDTTSHDLVWAENPNTSNYEVTLVHTEHNEEIEEVLRVSENRIPAINLIEGRIYTAKVKPLGNNIDFKDGEYSSDYRFLIMPKPNVTLNNGVITFERYSDSIQSLLASYELSLGEITSKTSLVPGVTSFDIMNINALNLGTEEKETYRNLNVIDLSIKAIPSNSNELDCIASLPLTQSIVKLAVQVPTLINGSFDGQITNAPAGSILKWSNSVNIGNFEYKIKITPAQAGKAIVTDTIDANEIGIYEYLNEKYNGNVFGDYSITISANSKVGKEAGFINSGEVSCQFSVVDLTGAALSVNEGRVEISNVASGFGDIIVRIKKGAVSHYAKASLEERISGLDVESVYICDVSDYVDESGELEISIYGIGLVSPGNVNIGVVNYSQSLTLGTVSKVTGVSNLSLASNGTLTFNFNKEAGQSFGLIARKKLNNSDEYFDSEYNITSQITYANGVCSVDLKAIESLEFDEDYLYNFGVKVWENGKVSSSTQNLADEPQIVVLSDPSNILANFSSTTLTDSISWSSVSNAYGYNVTIEGSNNGIDWVSISGANALSVLGNSVEIQDSVKEYSKIRVSVQATGVNNSALDSGMVEKVFDVVSFNGNPTTDASGLVSFADNNVLYHYSILDGETVFTSGTLQPSNLTLNLKELKSATGASLENNKTYTIKVKAHKDDNEYLSSDFENFYFKINNAPVFSMVKATNNNSVTYSLKIDGTNVKYRLAENEEASYSGVFQVTLSSGSCLVRAYSKGSEGALSSVSNSPSSISSTETQATIVKLAIPALNIENGTGRLSWTKVANSNRYELTINGNTISVSNPSTSTVSYEPNYDRSGNNLNTVSFRVIGNIGLSYSEGTSFTMDSNALNSNVAKSEELVLNVNNGKIYWAYEEGASYIVKLNNSELSSGYEISKETISNVDYSSLSIENYNAGDNSVSISVLKSGDKVYSNATSTTISKFDFASTFAIQNNAIVASLNKNGSTDITNSYVISGLKDSNNVDINVEIRNNNSTYELYLNGVIQSTNSLIDNDKINISLDYLKSLGFEIKTGARMDLTLTYVNKSGYANTSKTCSFTMLAMPGVELEDGKLKITSNGNSTVQVLVYEYDSVNNDYSSSVAVSKELNFSNSSLVDFSTSDWAALAGGRIKIVCSALGDGTSMISSQSREFETNLAPKKDAIVHFGEIELSSEYLSTYTYNAVVNNSQKVAVTSREISTNLLNLTPGQVYTIQIETSKEGYLFNKGAEIRVQVLNDISGFELDAVHQKLVWNASTNATGYSLKIVGENTTSYDHIEKNSTEYHLASNNPESVTYSIRANGTETHDYSANAVNYLTNLSYGQGVAVEFVDKFVSEISSENGNITWSTDYQNTIFRVNVYASDQSTFISSVIASENFADVSSVLAGRNSGVYYVSIELLSANGVIVCQNSSPVYMPVVYYNSNNIYSNLSLENGYVTYKINSSSITNYKNVLSSLPVDIRPDSVAINAVTLTNIKNSVEENDMGDANATLLPFFKNIIANINGVDYLINPSILRSSSSELVFKFSLDSSFDVGNYTISVKYDPSSLEIENLILLKGNSTSSSIGPVLKPTNPVCPPTVANNPINNGVLQFVLSKDAAGNPINDYKLYFTTDGGVEHTLNIIDQARFNNLANRSGYGYFEVQANSIATVNIYQFISSDFSEAENDNKPLFYNKLYTLSLESVGTSTGDSELRLTSASAVLENSFAKLKVENDVKVANGSLSLAEIYSSDMLNYISKCEINLGSVVYEFTGNELNEPIYFNGLAAGSYSSIKVTLCGNGLGVINSEIYSSSKTIEKLSTPSVSLSGGEFAFYPVRDSSNHLASYYLYMFGVEGGEEPNFNNASSLTVSSTDLTQIVMDDSYTGGRYCIYVYASENGDSLGYIRSDAAISDYYSRENEANGFALGESGSLSWSASTSESIYVIKDTNGDILSRNDSLSVVNGQFTINNVNSLVSFEANESVKDINVYVKAKASSNALNSANSVVKLTVKKAPENVAISNIGEITLAGANDVDFISSLLSSKYLIKFVGDVESFENGSWVTQQNKTLKVYLPNSHSMAFNTLFLSGIDCFEESIGANETGYVYDTSRADANLVQVRLIPGRNYSYSVRYVGTVGSISSGESSRHIVSTPDFNSTATILNKVTTIGVYEYDANNQISGVTSDHSYIYWNQIANASAYELVFKEIVVQNDIKTYADLNYIFDSNLNTNIVSSFISDNGINYLNIDSAVNEIRNGGINEFAICVRAIGGNGYLSCNILSDYAEIIIPSAPTNLAYDYTNGSITWTNTSSALTSFGVEVIYTPSEGIAYSLSHNNYGNISREQVEIDGNNYIKDTIELKYNSNNAMVLGGVNDFYYDDLSKVVTYKLRYLATEIKSIEVKAVSLSGNIESAAIVCENYAGDNKYFTLFNGGDGSMNAPFEVNNANQFGNITHFLDFNFKLVNNIEINGAHIDGEFKGSLDGANGVNAKYQITVSGTLYRTNNKVYIFENNQGIIKNIALVFSCSTPNYTSGISVSGLVYTNYGTISNITTSGSISNGTSQATSVGMIVYENYAVGTNKVTMCINRATVTNNLQNLNIGGIVCQNYGAISKCGNEATLTGFKVGGIAYQYSTSIIIQQNVVINYENTIITECYNRGELIASKNNAYLGGIVASFNGGTTYAGEISYCYTRVANFNSNGSSFKYGAGILAFGGNYASGSNLYVNIVGCYVNIQNVLNISNDSIYSAFVNVSGSIPNIGNCSNNYIYNDTNNRCINGRPSTEVGSAMLNSSWESNSNITDKYNIDSTPSKEHTLSWE